MPKVSRWMIRSSLLYLLLGVGLGALMLIHKAYPLHPAVWQLLPVHIEVTIFGWIIQFTLGTAYWMLPRFLEEPKRGNRGAAWLMVILLNLGILMVVADSLFSPLIPLRLAGRFLEVGAVTLFISLHWNRIVSYRYQ